MICTLTRMVDEMMLQLDFRTVRKDYLESGLGTCNRLGLRYLAVIVFVYNGIRIL